MGGDETEDDIEEVGGYVEDGFDMKLAVVRDVGTEDDHDVAVDASDPV